MSDKIPKVERALPPELIIWENIGIASKKKCQRIAMISVLVSITILVLAFVILCLNAWSNISENSGSECTEKLISLEEAFFGYQNDGYQSQELNCYCQHSYET